MRTRPALIAAIAISALAGGCTSQSPLESGASTLVVSAVLNAVHDDQIVVVQRTVDGAPHAFPVDSATVTITGPDGVAMTGAEMADSALTSSYHITLSAYNEQLVPGGTYQLRMKLRTGEEVTGTTTVPFAQPIALPGTAALPFDQAKDTLRLSWPAVQGASSYEVRVQSAARVYALFTDSAVALPGLLRTLDGKPVFAVGFDHQVIVSAVDANYYRYYRTNSDEFTGAAVQGNLTGAQGVFGSIVVVAFQTLRVTTTAH